MRTRIAGGLFVSHLRSETDLKSHKIEKKFPTIQIWKLFYFATNHYLFHYQDLLCKTVLSVVCRMGGTSPSTSLKSQFAQVVILPQHVVLVYSYIIERK